MIGDLPKVTRASKIDGKQSNDEGVGRDDYGKIKFKEEAFPSLMGVAVRPSVRPSVQPSVRPSNRPSDRPTLRPTFRWTVQQRMS